MRALNENQRPHDYKGDKMDSFPRPSHADWTYLEKYGVKASSGGGRSSARETLARVAAGAVAEKVLKEAYGVEIVAFTSSVGWEYLFPPTAEHPTASTNPEFLKLLETVTREEVDRHVPVRAPGKEACARMENLIAEFRDRKDSIGGTVSCVIRNCPSGLGEPVFDRLEAKLGHAMMSLPATKGFQIGSGFGGCKIPGSRHNDAFARAPAGKDGKTPRTKLVTKTNNSGGVQGGISNGAHVYFDVAFKPPATIGVAQNTAGYDEEDGVLEAKGRHDPCVIPRAIPIVEGMAAIAVLDAVLAQESRLSMRARLPVLDRTIPLRPVELSNSSEQSNANGDKV